MAGFRDWIRRLSDDTEKPRRKKWASPPPGETDDLDAIREENNDFALALYAYLRRRPGNLVFSPFSIRTALCMAQAGAKGKTRSQMRDALRMSSDSESFRDTFVEILQRLGSAQASMYEMTVANSLWGQDGAELLSEFVDSIARDYGGGINLVDFRGDSEAARLAINKWVEDKTRDKIRQLIPSSGLNEDTRLVLVNAVYFKGKWVLQFPKKATRDEPFNLEGGGTVQTPLMHQYENVRYMRSRGFQAVELIYQGHDVSMLVILPNRINGLSKLEERLTGDMLRNCMAQMITREVDLFLPRFKINWGAVDMSEHLIALGMPLAFDRTIADFSGINGLEPPDVDALFISSVFHKAFVDVNEEGTEAAAATAMITELTMGRMRVKPPRVPIFRADHPFLYAIRERRTGAILFLGRMTDPTLKN